MDDCLDLRDLWFNQFPKCPHCGHEDQDWWDRSLDFADGDRNEVDCPHCDESYWIESTVERRFTTAIEEDDL